MRIGLLFVLLISCLAGFTAQAGGVYRWVDADGRVVYGDTPPKKSGAKSVELPMLTVADGYAPPADKAANPAVSTAQQPPVGATDPAASAPEAYSAFKIASPTADETVRSNEGSVNVGVTLTPALKAGDEIVLYLDSKQVANGKALSFPLNAVEMGTHTVFAVLNDAAGNIVQNTETVTFHLHRNASVNQPSQQQQPAASSATPTK